MNFKLRYLLLILPVTILQPGFSQENKGPMKLSLKEAQEFALNNNRNIKSAKIDVQVMAKNSKGGACDRHAAA